MTTRAAAYSRFKHHACSYRSGLEEKTMQYLEELGVKATYESHKINYLVPESTHTYTPDFVLPNGIIIETKGVWDADDRKKHLLIKQQYPELDIRFVFSRSKTPIYKGSKTTYATFCDKYEIQFSDKVIPVGWLKERVKPLPKAVIPKEI